MANSPRRTTDDGATLRAIVDKLDEVSRLVAELAAQSAPISGDFEPRRAVDPGDAVPPGVAPETPAPLTPEDKKARRALERLNARRGKKGAADRRET